MNTVRGLPAAPQQQRGQILQPTPVRPLRADFLERFNEVSKAEAPRASAVPNGWDHVEEWVTAQQTERQPTLAPLLRAITPPPAYTRPLESRANPDHTFDAFLDPSNMIAMKDKKSTWKKVKTILRSKNVFHKSTSTGDKKLKRRQSYTQRRMEDAIA